MQDIHRVPEVTGAARRARSVSTAALLAGVLLVSVPRPMAETAYLGKRPFEVELLDENLTVESVIDVSCTGDGLATDGERIWCTSPGTVYTYDLSGALLDQWSYLLGPYDYTGGMTYIPETDELVILDVGTTDADTALRFFDPDTGEMTRTDDIGFGYIEGLTYDGNYLWSTTNSGVLKSYDVATVTHQDTLTPEVDGCFNDCAGLAALGPETLTLTFGPNAIGEITWYEVDSTSGATVASGTLPEALFGLEALQPLVCVPPPEGLVSWYKGDDCLPGDYLLENDGAYVSPAICAADFKVGGGALSFGGDLYVTVPHDPSLDPEDDELSIDAWIRTGGLSSQPIAKKQSGAGYGLSLEGGLLRFEVCDAASCHSVDGVTALHDDQWHLVAATLERVGAGAVLSVYADGLLEATLSIDDLGTVASTSELRLGASPTAGPPSSVFDGLMDEIEIFDRALLASEVESLFTAGAGGKCTADVCVGPPPGLTGWWPLDETTETTAADLTGNGDGVRVGCPTPVPGVVDGALEFYGAERVEVPDVDAHDVGTGDFTIDAWIRTEGDIQGEMIVDKREEDDFAWSGYVGYRFSLSSQGELHLRVDYLFGSYVYFGNTSVDDGDWHFVAVTVDRDDPEGLRFYVDGVLDEIADPTPFSIWSLSNDGDLWIGSDRSVPSANFDGAIDELELFDRALSGWEIHQLYAAGPAGKCKDASFEGLLLEATELHPGQPATLTARGAHPGEVVHFARGAGATCGPCIPAFGGLCVDIDDPALIGTATADQDGVARLELVVPASVPPGDVWMQATIARGQGGTGSVKSTVHATTIER